VSFETELLHHETLTKIVRDFKPTDGRLRSLFGPAVPVRGRSTNWDIVRTNRKIGTVVGPHASASVRTAEVIAKGRGTLARSFDSRPLMGADLLNLRAVGSADFEQNFKARIGREMKNLALGIDTLNEYMAAKALQGSLTLSVDGVSDVIDYHFPATHKLTVGGGELDGDTLVLSWDDPSADIIQDTSAIKQKGLDDSGYLITKCVVGSLVERAMLKLEIVQNLIKSTPDGVAMLREGFIGRINGIDFMSKGESYKDASGTIDHFVDEDTAVFMPDYDPEIMEWHEGTDAIPSDSGDDMIEKQGRYAYSSVNKNPAGYNLFMGEVRLPVIKNPGAFFKAVVIS